jgi:aminoglycoside 6'-N-acetyltransferase
MDESVSPPYTFKPVTQSDLPLLEVWLQAPEIVTWWGDPVEQAELLRADIHEPRMQMELVLFKGRPFAYLQSYEVHAWPQPHLDHLPIGSRAIDTFIGDDAMIGRGHGSAYLRNMALRLQVEGAPMIAIDPTEANLRAIRAYKNAGFRIDSPFTSREGPGVLMLLKGSPRLYSPKLP